MEFRAGDDVVHPSYGVGNIVRLEDRQLAEKTTRRYYVVAIGTATVWMPVNDDGSTSLRPVTARQDLERYRDVLKSRPANLDRDYRKRHLALTEQLAHSTFQIMCEVVRDLSALGQGRPIGETDGTMLKNVRANLWQEWATATGLAHQDAVHEIEALLLAGRTPHTD
jgi:RNA polymerase-interacting CarD/CdnL/TRCF family regulator